MKKPSITFDEGVKPFILDALGMMVNKKGYIVNKKTKKYVYAKTGHKKEKVLLSEFAGIVKDYGIIKGDIFSLIDYADWNRKHNKKSQ